MNQHAKIETVEVIEPRPPAFSDDALALRFSERHGETLRYVAAWGRWLQWSGAHWATDETINVFDLARAVCREAAAECNQPKVASAIASAKTVAAVERLARSDRRHAATVDQWDADPWLLNTSGGVVDLRTGDRRAARPEDHMTKITAVAPGGECPRWMQFLEEITAKATALLAQLAGDRAPIDAPGANKLIDTAVASKITRRSSSWLYSIARKHPSLGWKVAGSWVFSEPMLRAFMAGRAAQCEESEICEVCDAPGIQHTPNQAHISGTDAGTRT